MPVTRGATRLLFALALLGLLAAELLRVYWIMPFPGSQGGGTLAAAYALHRAIWAIRIVLGALFVWSAMRLFAAARWPGRAYELIS